MIIKKIAKKQITALLKEAAKERTVYAPIDDLGGDLVFQPLAKDSGSIDEALNRLDLSNARSAVPPKNIFFPQLEPLFKFDGDTACETIESSPKLLFGIRPCDLKGILFVDEFFKKNFEDIYYLSRIKDRFIVVLGCTTPPDPEACFCSSAKSGPFLNEGFDLQLVDIGDSYIVESGKAQGEEFLKKYDKFFSAADDKDNKQGQKTKEDSVKNVELKIDFQKAIDKMAGDFIPEENCKRIGERCLYCGACLYLCPTCTCFNVFDYSKDGKGIRYRNWDGCIFSGYTREASSHNPREEKWIRTFRRYEHKLKHDYQTTGKSGCVGCGRCLVSCPVEIGMSKFIQEITENKIHPR